MKGILTIFFCISGFALAEQPTEEAPIVNPPTGKIRGSILKSRLGRKIYLFRGIRYGEPPIGEQRFQPPIPANDWRNIFDATEEGPSCPHPGGKIMSEDCLRLNVYTTKLPDKQNVSRPVMIFIHPGAFYNFSGQSENFGPQYLLDKDIVLVTINYRLGTLGFLNTGDNWVPGNMGLKDQVLAFKWVQRNIAAFGGNPSSVTLCGYDAGSSSVMLHMVSPMSQNLFHRAIAMSSSDIGAEVNSSISQYGQLDLVKKQAKLLDCPTNSTSSMISCFRSQPVENFTKTLASLFDWSEYPVLLWTPAVEPEDSGIEKFLTDQPYNLIKQRKFHQVPLILGVTEDELGGMVANYERESQSGNDTIYREFDCNWNNVTPIACRYERNTLRSNDISKELREFYFPNQQINSHNNRKLAELLADCLTTFSMYRVAMLFATCSTDPVYFYKFTFQGRNSFYMLNDTTPYGVSHYDDLQYLFFMEDVFPPIEPNTPESSMVEISTSIWSNFVIHGNPTPDNRFNVTWTKLLPEQTNFLELNLHPSMKTEFFPGRMNLWERLFPKLLCSAKN